MEGNAAPVGAVDLRSVHVLGLLAGCRCGGCLNARHQEVQAADVAIVNRDLLHRLLLQRVGDIGLLGLEQSILRRDFDHLTDFADGELGVDRGDFVHGDAHALPHVSFEAGCFYPHVIVSNRKVRLNIVARAVGHGVIADTFAGLSDADFRSRNRRA